MVISSVIYRPKTLADDDETLVSAKVQLTDQGPYSHQVTTCNGNAHRTRDVTVRLVMGCRLILPLVDGKLFVLRQGPNVTSNRGHH